MEIDFNAKDLKISTTDRGLKLSIYLNEKEQDECLSDIVKFMGKFFRVEFKDGPYYSELPYSLAIFINKKINFQSNNYIIKNSFYEKYKDFCKNNNLKSLTKRKITSRLKGIDGIDNEIISIPVNHKSKYAGTTQRIYRGLTFKNEKTI